MMKKWLIVVCVAGLLGACKDDGRDDTILDMSLLTGKDWYYNGWLGDRDSYDTGDLLEVVRFEKGGTLKNIDFSGRREYIVGEWFTAADNQITLAYADGKKTVWNVQHSGNDYIRAIVNAQGVREYTTEPDYLGELTADVFFVNEYNAESLHDTRIGADVRGNINIREGQLLLADGNRVALENYEYYWSESDFIDAGLFNKAREVRFYLRIGKNNAVKLRDSLYSDKLPERTFAETNLNVNERNGAIRVTWKPYPEDDVYYRVEVLPGDMKLTDSYFISRVQNAGSNVLELTSTTAGEVNRLRELRSGETYVVRLTALLYEPGIDPWNNNYGYANVQAVAYFTKKFQKE